ncbi:hypothetical protein FA15DRAFT_664296 [Coprinopsis marcescibilis]|uniref:WW domain-containing protein n=1 Tax=Coprinopsis marcescibilis TaxID=230819 RepID=A0A5C3LBH5_COPMA|nr:hypothetical protein FA15DRAFT_664296 [Coprinopsis marcescibilis]
MAYTNSVDSGLKTRTNTLFNIDDPGHFVKSALLPDPWSICIHPRGWIYFRNASLKVVTDHDVRDETTLELVERAAMDFPIGALAEGMEVHLCHMHMMRDDLPAHEVPSNIFNLVVNHSSCVASYQIEDVLPENVPLLNAKLLNRVRRHYWNYVWNHPSHIPTPERAIRDATDALTMFWTDNLILGNQSTMPFSKAECEELSTILRDLHGNDHSTSKTMFLAWFLREVTSFRASESYGELTIKQTTSLKTQRESSLSARTLSPVSLLLIHAVINCFFFGIPHTYWAHIKATSEYRGRLADVQHKWEKYIERLVREYSHFLLISTVLLSATVGFLSIDNITEGARLAASVSALTSLASIIIGVFSVWRHQANTSRRHSVREGPFDSIQFL